MFTLIRNFIELIGAILILISIKFHADFWLLAISGGVILAAGLYNFFISERRKPFIGSVEVAGSFLLFLQIFRVAHPLISAVIGALLLLIAIPSIVGALLQ